MREGGGCTVGCKMEEESYEAVVQEAACGWDIMRVGKKS